MLWWASLLMFIGAMGFNISNIAGVLLGDVPLTLATSQEVGFLLLGLDCIPGMHETCGGGRRGCRGVGSGWVTKGPKGENGRASC